MLRCLHYQNKQSSTAPVGFVLCQHFLTCDTSAHLLDLLDLNCDAETTRKSSQTGNCALAKSAVTALLAGPAQAHKRSSPPFLRHSVLHAMAGTRAHANATRLVPMYTIYGAVERRGSMAPPRNWDLCRKRQKCDQSMRGVLLQSVGTNDTMNYINYHMNFGVAKEWAVP